MEPGGQIDTRSAGGLRGGRLNLGEQLPGFAVARIFCEELVEVVGSLARPAHHV